MGDLIMSKYHPLSERLADDPAGEWRASFAEIEEVLGFPLPKAARRGGAWWSAGEASPHARAWYGQGWSIGEVDPATGMVTFRRVEVSPAAMQAVLDVPAPVASAEPKRRGKQPLDMRLGAQVASVVSKAPRWGVAAAIAGGAVVLGAVGAMALRGRVQKRSRPEA
jgi:hypothetical protein